MSSSRDRVLSGDYMNYNCWLSEGVVKIFRGSESIPLNKSTVESYEVLDADIRKSGTSAILRAGTGALLLGPIGLIAGVTGKKKGIYTIAIHFKDGKKSLIEINEKAYKKLVQDLF